MEPRDRGETPVIGARFGAYRVLRELGSGGMGSVYLAEREDDDLRMKVCVKLLHADLDSPEILARFHRERQLLADLRHPHIATLLDAGQTETARPYFIMEYLDGQHIDTWYDQTQPDLPNLLETLIKMVQAAAHAHRRGVVHRDIKPGNILVNSQNTPTLLDFGIAHITEPGGIDAPARAGRGPMTPVWAAPEQQFGFEITPATDVYALGLVLLKLFSGRMPNRLGCSPREAVGFLVQGKPLPTAWTLAMDVETVESPGPATAAPVVPVAEAAPAPSAPLPEALGYVLRRCLADEPGERFADGSELVAAFKRLQEQGFQTTDPVKDEPKSLDAVFWFHELDRIRARALMTDLAAQSVLRMWPDESLSDTVRLVDAEFENALTQSRTLVVCFASFERAPWKTHPARRDAAAFFTRDLAVIPVLLDDTPYPERQSALPGFLRGRSWLRVGGAGDAGLQKLAAAVTGSPIDEADRPQPTGLCPFRGLEVFREADQHLFFGREAVSRQIFEHQQRFYFSAVMGPSGSGKSSIVQAGVMPRLRKRGTAVVQLTPTAQPLAELAFTLGMLRKEQGGGAPVAQLHQRLRAAPEGLYFIVRELLSPGDATQICLVIDQFEELFTLASADEAATFAEALCLAVERLDGQCRVLLTMRSDFLGKCVAFPNLNKYVVDHLIQVEPMTREDLARAIEAPTHWGGLRLENGLLERLLDDVTGAAGELPLLEHALMELYERREEGFLTLAAYNRIGGIAGALAQRAEHEFSRLSAAEQQALRKMFTLCLVQPGEGAEDTRRRATKAELLAVGGDPAESLLAHWTGARLLSGSHDPARDVTFLDVAHEALIRNWERIGEWMAEDRETARRFNRLRRAATEWDDADRDQDRLLRGGPLLQMMELRESHGDMFGSLETAYLNRAVELMEREARWKRRRLAFMTVLGLVSTLLAIISWVLSVQSQEHAEEAVAAKERAEAEESRAKAQTLAANYNLALAFNEKAGIALDDGKPKDAWLYTLAALSREIPPNQVLPEPVGRFADPRMEAKTDLLWTSPVAVPATLLTATPDGKILALVGRDGGIRILNTETGVQVSTFGPLRQSISDVAIRSDGKWLAAGTRQGEVVVWNLLDSSFYQLDGNHKDRVVALAFSEVAPWLASAGNQGIVKLHHLDSGDVIPILDLQEPAHLAYQGGTLFMLNRAGELYRLVMEAGRPKPAHLIKREARGAPVGLVSLGEARLVTADKHGILDFYDEQGRFLEHQDLGRTISSMAAGSHPYQLLVGGEKKRPLVWDSRRQKMQPRGYSKGLRSMVFHGDSLSGLDRSGSLQRFQRPSGERMSQPLGHGREMLNLAFSPDGNTLAGAARDGGVTLWDLQTGKAKVIQVPQAIHVWSVSFSPDGDFLAIGIADGAIHLWDLRGAAPQEYALLMGHEGATRSLAFASDGSWLASGSSDKTLRIWDLRGISSRGGTVENSRVLRGHTGIVYGVDVSLDGTWMASASMDGTVRLWDLTGGVENLTDEQAVVLRGHGGDIWGLAFSPDGRLLASGSTDFTIRLWDLSLGREKVAASQPWILETPGGYVSKVAFSPDGHWLASAHGDNRARLWSLRDGPRAAVSRKPRIFEGHNDSLSGVVFSPDGRRIATCSNDLTVRLWDVKAAESNVGLLDQSHELRGHSSVVVSVAFSPNGSLLASTSADKTIRLWRNARKEGRPFFSEHSVLQGHSGVVIGVAFSPDGSRLASGSFDSTVRLWDLAENVLTKEALILRGHRRFVHGVAFSPDGSLLASASMDQTVRLWSLDEETLGESVVLQRDEMHSFGVAFSPDGTRLVSTSLENKTRIWDLREGWKKASSKPEIVLRGHSAIVIGVSFSPDGRLLATASGDHTVRLWTLGDDIDSARTIRSMVLRGHSEVVYGVNFSPDGTLLVSTSQDKTVRIWDPRDGRPLAVFYGHTASVNQTPAFHPSGRLLATASDDHTIRLWHMDRLLFPPDGVQPHGWYRTLLDRSLYQMGRHLDGLSLIHRPHLRLQGVDMQLKPSPLDHLDRPYQPGTDYARWLLGEVDQGADQPR
ncbi:nSTAND1 domain-containing NTPase [Acanthopleuribacter pedis]|uniref:Protein kinase n=1 Tax=Acanthopleuribacter pedis TaxID=442870 RepID=A0A8J7QIL5_9BACT|nr:protein kinase [Acanthopleuribacter pedis]MBO1318998.1 protein kinase [Acanthopleuribacter pedis]